MAVRAWTGDSPRHRRAGGRLTSISDLGPDLGIIPTGYERTLPPEVQLLVRARRRSLSRQARGRVLDLGGAASHERLWDRIGAVGSAAVLSGANDPELLALARGTERFDTVFSTFQLAAANDLPATLRRIDAVLAPEGTVLFLEPARLVGVSGRIQRIAAPSMAVMTGWRADRDVPGALRASGLSVTRISRHRAATLQWWIRELVEGAAHRSLLATEARIGDENDDPIDPGNP